MYVGCTILPLRRQGGANLSCAVPEYQNAVKMLLQPVEKAWQSIKHLQKGVVNEVNVAEKNHFLFWKICVWDCPGMVWGVSWDHFRRIFCRCLKNFENLKTRKLRFVQNLFKMHSIYVLKPEKYIQNHIKNNISFVFPGIPWLFLVVVVVIVLSQSSVGEGMH